MDYLRYFREKIPTIEHLPTEELLETVRVLTREVNEWDFANKLKPEDMLWRECKQIYFEGERVRITPQFLLNIARITLLDRGYSYEQTYKESDIAAFNKRLPYLNKLQFSPNGSFYINGIRELEIVENSEKNWAELRRQEELNSYQMSLFKNDVLPQIEFTRALANVGLGGWSGFKTEGLSFVEEDSWDLHLDFSDGKGSVSFSGLDYYPETFVELCRVLFCKPPEILDDDRETLNIRLPNLSKLSFTIGGFFGATETRTIHVDRSYLILESADYEAFTLKDGDRPHTEFKVHKFSLEEFTNELENLDLGLWEENYFSGATDGTSWWLKMEFSDGGEPFESSGNNDYPENFDELLRLLSCSTNEPEEDDEFEDEDEEDY
ncbi:hypothetical protein SFC07_07230 [Corynebacterium callunae]|uniref:hypothetical protein n=1 Tax=Corynebacterium callunae TaxID=1721 RepID=UPI0039823ED0